MDHFKHPQSDASVERLLGLGKVTLIFLDLVLVFRTEQIAYITKARQ